MVSVMFLQHLLVFLITSANSNVFVYFSVVSGCSAVHMCSLCYLDFSTLFGVLSWWLNKFVCFLKRTDLANCFLPRVHYVKPIQHLHITVKFF